jgi:hypothetical protein
MTLFTLPYPPTSSADLRKGSWFVLRCLSISRCVSLFPILSCAFLIWLTTYKMPASRLHPETLAPSMDLARRSRYMSTPCIGTILIGLSLSSHHLTLASVLAGEMCEHCHKEASGGIDLLTLIRYVEQGCSYYRIVLSAVDWAVPTLFTYDDIKLIFGFKLHRIHVSRRSDRKWAERVSLTVFRIPGRLLPVPFETLTYLSERLSNPYIPLFSGAIRKAARNDIIRVHFCEDTGLARRLYRRSPWLFWKEVESIT